MTFFNCHGTFSLIQKDLRMSNIFFKKRVHFPEISSSSESCSRIFKSSFVIRSLPGALLFFSVLRTLINSAYVIGQSKSTSLPYIGLYTNTLEFGLSYNLVQYSHQYLRHSGSEVDNLPSEFLIAPKFSYFLCLFLQTLIENSGTLQMIQVLQFS